jgi:hypothetical protein
VKSGVTHKLASLKQVRALIHFALRSSPQPGRDLKKNQRKVACKREALAGSPNSFPTPSWLGLKKLEETDKKI